MDSWILKYIISFLIITLVFQSSHLNATETEFIPNVADGKAYISTDKLTPELIACFQNSKKCHGTKLSLSIQLYPEKIQALSCRRVLTTGGDTPYAHGFYLHFEAAKNEFCFGVTGIDSSSNKVTWEACEHVSISQRPITITGVWEDRSGLILFVDGMRTRIVNNGQTRLFLDYYERHGYPVQETMTFCPEKGISSLDVLGIVKIKTEQAVWTTNFIQDYTIQHLKYTVMGCAATIPSSLITKQQKLVGSTSDHRKECWSFCSYESTSVSTNSKMSQLYSIQESTSMCTCVSNLQSVSLLNLETCSTNKKQLHETFLTSQSRLEEPYNIDVQVTCESAFTKDNIYTHDEVTCDLQVSRYQTIDNKIALSSSEYVLKFNKGDGVDEILQQSKVSCSYGVANDYTIKFTVESDYGTAEKSVPIKVLDSVSEQSVDIELTEVSASQNENKKEIIYSTIIAGKRKKTCTIYCNNNTIETFEVDTFLSVKSGTFSVTEIGLCNLRLHVTNGNKEINKETTVIVTDLTNVHSDLLNTESLKIPFKSAKTNKNHIKILSVPGTTSLTAQFNDDEIVVPAISLNRLNKRNVQLFVEFHGELFLSRSVTIYKSLESLNIVAEKRTGLKTDEFPIEFIVKGKGDYDIIIDSGATKTYPLEYLKIDGLNGQLKLPRSYVYNDMGVFTIKITVCHKLGCESKSVNVGTLVKVYDAKIITDKVDSIAKPVQFVIEINKDVGIAVGSETSALLTIDGMEPKPCNLHADMVKFQFMCEYILTSYGRQTLNVTFINALGNFEVEKVIQVGEEIAPIDAFVLVPVASDQDASIYINMTTGSPLEFQFTVGKQVAQKVIKIAPFVRSEHVENSVLFLGLTSTSTNDLIVKESLETSETEVGKIKMTTKHGPIIFSLNNKILESGANTINLQIKNIYNNQSVKVCHSLIGKSERCNFIPHPSVDNHEITGDELITSEKSKEIKISYSFSGGCGSDYAHEMEIYQFIDPKKSDNTEYTNLKTLGLCQSNLGDDMKIAPHYLDYGSYFVREVITSDTNKQDYFLKTYNLKIVKSELIANLYGPAEKGINFGDTLKLNFSASVDPDDLTNTNKIEYVVTCITDDEKKFQNQTCWNVKSDADYQEINVYEFKKKTLVKTNDSEVYMIKDVVIPLEEREISIKLFDYKGKCFLKPDEVGLNQTAKIIDTSGDNLNQKSLLKFQLCMTDSQGRTKTVSQNCKVMIIKNLDDAMKQLENVNVKDPDSALRLMSNLNDKLNESPDEQEESKASALKESMCQVVSEVAKNLQTVDQASTMGQVLTDTTTGGVTDNAAISAGAALDNGAGKVDQMPATVSQTETASKGIVDTVGNIAPEETPEQLSEKAAEANMKNLGFMTKNQIELRRKRRSLELASEKNETDKPDLIVSYFDCHGHNLSCSLINQESPLCPLMDDFGQLQDRPCIEWFELFDCNFIQKMSINFDPEEKEEYHCDKWIEKQAELEAKRQKQMKMTKSSVKAMGTMGGKFVKQKASKVEVSNPKLALAAFTPSKRRKRSPDTSQGVDTAHGGASIPDDVLPTGDGIGASCTAMSTNPHTYGGESMTSSGLVSLGFSDASGRPVPVNNLKNPITIIINQKNVVPTVRYFFMANLNNDINCHCMALNKTNRSFGAFVKPENPNDQLTVHFSLDDCPTMDNSLIKVRVPRTEAEVIQSVRPADRNRLTPEMIEELKYTVLVPQNMTTEGGKFCFGISLWSTQYSGAVDERNVTYLYGSFVNAPRYLDEVNNTWQTEGVTVGNLTCRTRLQLLVSHLTSFGSDFVVPPNTIDFSNVWAKFAKLNENSAVFATVISILILFIISMVWARFADRKDVIRWGATHLEDNLPTDTYNYQIQVMTGYRNGSGTKSKVFIILSGDDGDTGIRKISDGHRKGFERGSVLNFILSTENSLGPLTFLRIWHDNSGKGKEKSWYLDQFVINDLQTGEKYFFLCNNWLAVEEGDGQVERTISVSGLADLVAFKQLFTSSVQRKLRNEHLWFSVFSRPTRSNFTRMQRISCCLSLLFLTMITNAMFFKAEDNVKKKTGVTVGPITFTMDQIFISIISTLIVFPPSILIVTFFKKCKAASVNKVIQENQDLSSKSSKYKWRTIDKNNELFSAPEEGASSMVGWGNSGIQKKHNNVWDKFKNLITIRAREREEEDPEIKKKKPFLFPHWCIYIAWVLVFFSVFGSAFFVILYSMEWGKAKAEEWLITFILSFFQSVVIVQPVKVLVLAAVISMILKKPEFDDEEAAFDNALINHNEEILEKKTVDIQQVMLQRRTARSDLNFPNEEKLAAIREVRMKEIKMTAIIKEMIAYTIFVLVVFFISYQTRSLNSFRLGDVMRKTFVNDFKANIKDFSSFYTYLNDTMLPKMYSGDFENGKRATWRDLTAINDGSRNIIRIGVPRLRQFRIKDDTCRTQKAFTKVIQKHCRSSYGWIDDDTKPYEPFWKPMDERKWESLENNKSFISPFVYRSAFRLKGLPYMAAANTYKGGGYVVNFNKRLEKTQKIVNEIYAQNWIDTRTRAVFIEFTVYNTPSNLFASVIMVAEFLETGGAITYTEVKIFRLFSYVGSFGAIVLFMEIVFACFVLYFSIREGMTIKKEGCKYFNGFWNILEFTTLCITCASVVMYIFKKILASVAMDALKDSKASDYVNFGSIATYDELYAYMVGIVVFISTIKFIKILKFNRRMGMLGSTIKLAARDLKSFSFMFAIYFMAFCHSAYLVFGRQVIAYGTFVGTWEALFSMALGSFNFYELHAVSGLLGPIFFFSFICLVTFGLLGIFLTIINDTFATVKANADLQSNDYELVDFMMKRMKAMFGISNIDTTGDAEEEKTEEDEDDSKSDYLGSSIAGSLAKLRAAF